MATEKQKVAEKKRKERQLTESLLTESEELLDNEKLVTIITSESLEKLQCWDATIPNCKYAPAKRRRQATMGQSQDDTSFNYSTQYDGSKWPKNHDLAFVDCLAWKLGVEPKTYHYQPNNGRYRASKLAPKFVSERESRKSEKLNVEQRQQHRDLQRRLQKQFDGNLRMETQSEGNKDQYSMQGSRKDCDTGSAPHGKIRIYNNSHQVDMPDDSSGIKLPPIKAPRPKKGESQLYMNHRLSKLDDEMVRDSHVRRRTKSSSPEEVGSKKTRSRSEPPPGLGLGPVGDNNSLYSSGKTSSRRKSKYSVFENTKADAQVQELASKLVVALAELKKSRDMEQRLSLDRSLTNDNIDSLVKDKTETPLAEPFQSEVTIEKISGDQRSLPQGYHGNGSQQTAALVTHSVKYTTATGDVISIPKFGRYSGSNSSSNAQETVSQNQLEGKEKTNVTRKRKSSLKRTRSTSGKSQVERTSPTNQHSRGDSAVPKEPLDAVMTTSGYHSANGNSKSSIQLSGFPLNTMAVDGMKMVKGPSKVITDSFHSVPVGKNRHRDKEDATSIARRKHNVLPEIAGQSVPSRTVTSNRIL